MDTRPTVGPVAARDRDTRALVAELTAELAAEGYTEDQTFGYSLEQLEEHGVVLVGARVDGELVGIGGLEVQGGGYGELKRFYVRPALRPVRRERDLGLPAARARLITAAARGADRWVRVRVVSGTYLAPDAAR